MAASLCIRFFTSDITDHLAEYATLKAIGYRDPFLFKIMLQQAFILSIFGFLPGIVAPYFLHIVARQATLLPLSLTLSRGVGVYMLTFVMCSISALLTLRRLSRADPAEIFSA